MRRVVRIVLVAGALWSALAGVGTAPAGSTPPPGPLRAANAAAARPYRFAHLTSCRVGDALSVLEVAGAAPAHLVALSLLFGGDVAARDVRTTFRLVAFRRGTFTGQLGASFRLTSLDLGTALGAATGAWVRPLATSGRWYVVVADVRVVRPIRHAWRIEGLGVSYAVGSAARTQLFPQSIALPATPGCR